MTENANNDPGREKKGYPEDYPEDRHQIRRAVAGIFRVEEKNSQLLFKVSAGIGKKKEREKKQQERDQKEYEDHAIVILFLLHDVNSL